MKAVNTRISHYRIAFLAVMLAAASTLAQKDGWDAPPSMIVDKSALYEQHYGKKGYAVLPDTLFSFSDLVGDRFAVLGNTVVPLGTKVEVPSRCGFYFLPEGQITVGGKLVAQAKSPNGIEFSPMPPNDRYIVSDSPDLSWRGIKIDGVGSVVLKNVAIIDAASGITSEAPCDSLDIEGLTYFGASAGVLSMLDSTLAVKANEPVSLDCREIFGKEKMRAKKNPLKVISVSVLGALTVAGTATSLVLNSKANTHIDEANAATTTARGDSEEQKAGDAIKLRNVMTVVTAACATATLVTIVIPFGKK